jgi:beta-glucosidase
VGGTSLTKTGTGARGWSETAWSGTGSGCSAYEPKPAWQTDTGCSGRTVNDVAAVADPTTPVAAYYTPTGGTSGIWQPQGGTVVAAGIIAATYALAGPPAAGTYPAAYPYQHPGGSYTTPGHAYPYAAGLNNITSGSNGICSAAYQCKAGPGYNGPTGLGSPAFSASFSSSGNVTGSIYSGMTNLCLDDYQGSTTDGNKIDVWTCNTDGAQNWAVEADGTVEAGGRCLDVTNGGTANGTKVQLYSCQSGDKNQQWRPIFPDELLNPQSGKCLDDTNSSTTDGTQVQIYSCVGGPQQDWNLPYSVPQSTGQIKYQADRSKCVDNSNGGTANNNKIQLWNCDTSTASQNWTVQPGGTITIDARCMATQADGTADGTPVVLYGCTGDTNQQWVIRSDGSLLNRRSKTCLDNTNGNTANGNPLQLYDCLNNANQRWALP